ncbi:MAG: aspartate carbamoyltransferase catalytic subunit [Candidatus Krumholzibacteria bacterium]|nr:aspartate carbamoyltransferase catalytic subunit [Candidatus Krumholzibacteria bacterium]MDH4336986.1 aspartate carbamoyltransferase catalytic subunit [Candidatus Krumholzibacteria bacterium]MDH5270699.1 aspartate carbamoyltransferase catalytic subunit [Candidatus Krumholzibacteria bacterium]MDH5626786.1 aspartate carbamoyltransferase catalytic subunit [Candidatus Krumholzibacteria bacterium]
MTQSRHLLGLEGMSAEDLIRYLDTAESFKEISERPVKKVPALRGITVANLFFEPSTRTRISFELAEKRLSADSVNFSASGSSVSKGETLRDTAENIEAMKVDMIVIRHGASGAPHFLASLLDGSVVNAGDGSHEHPTQGLLDMFTLRERWGSFEGKKVVIVGDVAHSRVARSNIHGLVTMGVEVVVCGPPTLMPPEVERFGVRVETDLKKAVEGADAINVLRIQRERQKAGMFPSLDEYARVWGINTDVLKNAQKNCIVMHPGPMNRGIEIAQDVADGERSVILDQVTNGVAVRMAVLYLVSGAAALELGETQTAEQKAREGKQVA